MFCKLTIHTKLTIKLWVIIAIYKKYVWRRETLNHLNEINHSLYIQILLSRKIMKDLNGQKINSGCPCWVYPAGFCPHFTIFELFHNCKLYITENMANNFSICKLILSSGETTDFPFPLCKKPVLNLFINMFHKLFLLFELAFNQ